MTRKERKKYVMSVHTKLKKTTWRWCAKYIKLRDAIEDLSVTNDISLVHCRACDKWIKTNSREAQASHFFGRGVGGGSGAYFDERNIHICCYQCNAFKGGNLQSYREFMLDKYGQKVIDELEIKHRAGHKWTELELIALTKYFKDEFKRMSSQKRI